MGYYSPTFLCYNNDMNKDELLISRIEDAMRRAAEDYYVVTTKFLDAHEQAVADRVVRSGAYAMPSDVSHLFYGGYEQAERRMLVCIPNDFDVDDAVSSLLKVLRISIPRGSKQLNHRDYLGSVLNLGIERYLIGDILVRDDGADMIIFPEIGDFLMQEYSRVAHTEIMTELVEITELIIPEGRMKEITDTVSTLRLDSIISSAFGLSRTKGAEAFRSGIVTVNHIEATKPDMKLEEGDVLVLKGKGKALLSEVGAESKKGRIWIKINKYI